MQTVSQFKKDRKALDIKLKTDQDVYLLGAFMYGIFREVFARLLMFICI